MSTRRPVLLFAATTGAAHEAWLDELRVQLPEVELRVWPEAGDPAEVDYVMAWKTPAEAWRGLTRLKAIFSLGAGVERLLDDPAVPTGPPLVRMLDPSLVVGMREYVLARVLHHHRQFDAYAQTQEEARWRPRPQPLPGERRVGIMGMGELGRACAVALAGLGFDVAGWSRTPRPMEGVEGFAGWEALPAFAARSEIVVCLLPLTGETAGVLNARLFDAMPRGGGLINVARGGHLHEADLLAALDDGRLSGATLDVFETEPLPPEHPFWRHPRIVATPHVSAVTHPRTATTVLAANLRACEAGAPMTGVVDRARGY